MTKAWLLKILDEFLILGICNALVTDKIVPVGMSSLCSTFDDSEDNIDMQNTSVCLSIVEVGSVSELSDRSDLDPEGISIVSVLFHFLIL